VIDIDNPAGRFYNLLQQAKTRPDTHKVRDVWAHVFDESQKDDSAITRKVVELYQLGEEVKQLISMNNGVNKELYLSSFPQVERAIFPLNLNTTWQGQKQQLNDGVMTRLQFCSELLSSFYKEEQLSVDELKSITTLIDNLFEAVLNGSLEESIRLTLLEEIERLRTALSMYKIKGAKGLKQSLQSTIGMVVANKDDLSKANEKDKYIIDRLGFLIDKIDSFTAKALKVHKVLSKPFQSLLGLVFKNDSTEVVVAEAGDIEV
jgi:hypothetical protein